MVAGERRATARVAPADTTWRREALLRPGQEVLVIDLSSGGALLESAARMSPGARAELQLIGAGRRLVRGRIGRCQIVRLEPLCYRGAMVFEQPLEFAIHGGATFAAAT
jgi:hypothetical protein